jgi:glyoxylase-like metal-dependent hydrolase (beta-lactamase superfamily II)
MSEQTQRKGQTQARAMFGAILSLMFAATLGVTSAWAQSAMKLQQVTHNTWYVQGESALGSSANRNFISNAGFVITPAGVVVVDALGSPALAQELIALIRQRTPLPITHVLVTHYHADHIYGLQAFEGAQIWAHEAGKAYLNSDTAQLRLAASREEMFPWVDEQTRLVNATRWLSSRTELVVGGVAFVLAPLGPAHTPEDLVVHVPSEGVLFSGDLVFRGRIPFVGHANSRHWLQALQTMLGFEAHTVVPGHGPASHQARQDMQLTYDYLAYLRQSMGQAAKDMVPFEEAYAQTNWQRFEHLPLFKAANRMNAYNTYLEMERE